VYVTGKISADGWKSKGEKSDFYYLKGITGQILSMLGVKQPVYNKEANGTLDNCVTAVVKNEVVATIGMVNKKTLAKFDIKQPVLYADINWDKVVALHKKQNITFAGIPKFPAVQRDLAIVVDKSVAYQQVDNATRAAKVSKLQSVNLFDIFENEKIGAGKKSMAVSFTFLDEEKTMTDKDIDAMMAKIINTYEKELNAEIRK
jgi:phenylalanyl-tRNA synthetase beta chain